MDTGFKKITLILSVVFSVILLFYAIFFIATVNPNIHSNNKLLKVIAWIYICMWIFSILQFLTDH